MKKRGGKNRKGQSSAYREIGTGTQRQDEVVYTSAFRTRQKFGAASPVRYIPVSKPKIQSDAQTVAPSSTTKGERVLRCNCGHEVSEVDFLSNLPTPKPIDSLADLHLIADRLRCGVCKRKGAARAVFKVKY